MVWSQLAGFMPAAPSRYVELFWQAFIVRSPHNSMEMFQTQAGDRR